MIKGALIALMILATCLMVGCATKEKPRAMPENHPLELMMWLEKYGEESVVGLEGCGDE